MPEPTAEAFIHPRISQISALVQSGRLIPEERAKPFMVQWTRVPPELLPFVQSRNLSTLAQVLRAHPRLYRHPLVGWQISYLERLCYDENEWERLGWRRQRDDEGQDGPPHEVAVVWHQLRKLDEAYMTGKYPGTRIEWKPQPKQRGPKSGFHNPHPADPWDEWVGADQLERDFRRLHSLFKSRLKAIGGKVGPTKAQAKEWYRQLAQTGLEESGIWWSSWKGSEVVERPVTARPTSYPCQPGPAAPAAPQDGNLWLDTAATPYLLKQYEAASATWHTAMTINEQDVAKAVALVDAFYQPIHWDVTEHWKPLELDAALDKLVNRQTGKIGQSAYLAYAVLGALLAVTPEKIRNTLDNFRHKRRPKQTR